MRKQNKLIVGIGHRIKSLSNPDKRVTIIKEFAKANFPAIDVLDFALEVEQVTTKKRSNLIQNVDRRLYCSLFRGPLALEEAAGRRKRALEDTEGRSTSPLASFESEIMSPQLLDAQVGLSVSAGDHVNVETNCRRSAGAIKNRRLNEKQDNTTAQFPTNLSMLSGPVSPRLQMFRNDVDVVTPAGQDNNAPFVTSPYRLQKEIHGLERPVFACGGGEHRGRAITPSPLSTAMPAVPVPEMHKTSPLGHQSVRNGEINVGRACPDMSLIGNQEQKSPILQQSAIKEENVPSDRTLPTLMHFLEASGQKTLANPAYGPLQTPYRVPTITSTSTPSSKQVTRRQPFPFPQRRDLETTKGITTPVIESTGMFTPFSNAPPLSFNVDDLSSDEELLGIPGPDFSELEVSYSQTKFDDLSVTESNLAETVALTLCEGLANSLSTAERERMEVLSLLTIPLTPQSSPITLGRDQFQDVFGDNIRGGMISHLSRSHCLIHVHEVPSQDNGGASKSVKVWVEDTSTNGIRVNGIPLKNCGQSHELALDDVVTLLRIRQDEVDVSLEYKLVRSDLQLKQSTKKGRKSRHDGRYVKFSRELAGLSDGNELSPLQKSDVTTPRPKPARAITQDLRHRIPTGSFSFAEALSVATEEIKTNKPTLIPKSSILARKIRCTILFADQTTQDFPDSSEHLEEANFEYREELSEVLSAFASICTFDASSFHCATEGNIKEALHDDSHVIFYTGGGDENHIICEAPNGLSARLEKDKVRELVSSANNAVRKLIVVIAPSREPASLLAECGAAHVCYLSSASKHSLRVTSFIRALNAGLLKGFSIEKSYTLAEFVALNDLLPILRPSDQICELLPLSVTHSTKIGSIFTEAVAADKNVTIMLNGTFIPVLATHFLGREAVVRKIKAALTQNVRVCNIYGARGVGKSSIAIHIAKTLYRTRCYKNGVHYFAVDKLVEHLHDSQTQEEERARSIQQEDALPRVMRDVETLLRSLPETECDNSPTTLVVLDGCDMVLPALEVFVLNTIRAFLGVQILLTSTEQLRLDIDEEEGWTEEAIPIHELGKLDSAKLFLKQARCHLTSRQFRQHFPDSSIEAISNDSRLIATKGNPVRISRLVYELESQTASSLQL